MARSLKEQSIAFLASSATKSRNKKGVLSNTGYKAIKSARSFQDTAYALAHIAQNLGVTRLKHITEQNAYDYLDMRTDNYASQKSLDRDRKALSIALGVSIERRFAINEVHLKGRSYTNQQVNRIANHMSERNRLSLRIAHDSGLRAHELLTIRRAGELERSASRKWSNDRFVGREGVLYIVTGKGGLKREVLIRKDLSFQLEERRLDKPVKRLDRGVEYRTFYDIGGGNALSSSFTRASNRAYGYSTGLHGVRHSYAQLRIDEIKHKLGVNHSRARDILAQELGHFRGKITNTYLR